MARLDYLIDNKILQNLFIWFCLFLILLGTIQSGNKVTVAFFIILLLAPAVYINNFFVLPFFYKNRIRFLGLFLINAAIFTGIAAILIAWSLDQAFKWTMFLNFFGVLVLALTFGSAVKISRDSFIRRQEEKNAELKLLKAQLNPHFLFNTLNNLYGLSVVKSDKLPDLMLKLSDLLRYSLYDTKEIYVPLEKEIQYLRNYMSLEKIRLEETTDIQLVQTGHITSKKIAPMLLIVFVENAFKHLANTGDGKSRVAVELNVTNDSLSFSCSNSIDKNTEDVTMETGKSGIGLNNAKKRLALLYPDKHRLTITKSDTSYDVKLTLDL